VIESGINSKNGCKFRDGRWLSKNLWSRERMTEEAERDPEWFREVGGSG